MAPQVVRVAEVIPWGRSFEEYRRMFALSAADLAGRILGCGDGPASFNAEATARGHAVVSCDPIYACPPAEIERRVEGASDRIIALVRRHLDGFVWDHFHGPDHLGQCRLAALRRFLADFEAGQAEGRYVTASRSRMASSTWPLSPTCSSCTPANWTSSSTGQRSRSCYEWPGRSASSPC